jgi:hydantoinase/carbamoylase family amidase
VPFRVNQDRLGFELDRFARIGASSEGGVTRLAFSPEEGEALRQMESLLQAEGLIPRRDAFGNRFARREGAIPGLPVLMVGSHLDTVPDGGRFDGALGVIAGLEIVRVLRERGIQTRHPIEVVAFVGEEAARFGMGCLGSRASVGTLDLPRLLAARDLRGISGAEAIRQAGLDPDQFPSAVRPPGEIAAFLELHIEQGRVLEAEQKAIGIVTDVANYTRLNVEVIGRADHSGATPMPLRKDALAAASEMVLAVEEAVAALGQAPSVGTVGVLRVDPGAVNVIPGSVAFEVDVRDIDFDRKARIAGRIRERIAAIAKRRGVEAKVAVPSDGHPVPLSATVVETIRQAAEALALPARRMVSGAGHDAMHLAPFVPSGMIFVPSREGRSHSRLEWTDLPDLVPGVEVLLETLLRLDKSET